MNVEFVSVNPTGPLHVGHARYASYGDALCRIFAFVGHDVTREFYVNDYGTQMLRFGQSLAARYGQRLGLDTPVPEEGYQGDYLLDLADELIADGRRPLPRRASRRSPRTSTALPADVVGELKLWGRDAHPRPVPRHARAPARAVRRVDAARARSTSGDGEHRGFGGEVGKSLADLDGEGLLYDEEGAVWLKTTRYGDDKDRVLIRQTGEPTYFLSDIAYHRDKMDRGFEHMIDIWGADHHGYVPRMKAAFTALPPHDPDRLELIIGQLVNLLESGEARRMSKRTRRHRHRGRPRSTRSAWTRRGSCSWAARTTRRSSSTSTSPCSRSTRTPCTTCSTRTRASAASCATCAERRGAAGGRSRAGRDRRAARARAAAGSRALPATCC